MFARPVRAAFAGALLGLTPLLVPLSAQAVVQGQVTRDPDGLRASVVRIESSSGEICSGTLIAQDLVLTAAHCVMQRVAYSVVVVDPSFRQRRIPAVAASMHPDFVPGTTPEDQPGIDLAMLKLARPVGPGFRPLDPSGNGGIDSGDGVDIAGFGVVSESNRGSARTLRTARLVSIGALQVANRVTVVTDARRLAETAGAGACLGDSGGPILRGGRMVGVVSWSSGAMRQGRARTACGGFTAVTPTGEHASWINSRAAAMEALAPAAVAGQGAGDTQWVAQQPRRTRR